MSHNWWLSHFKPDPGKLLTPERNVDIKDVFATYHYITLTKLSVDKLHVPQAYAMGNALWITSLYFCNVQNHAQLLGLLDDIPRPTERLIAGLKWRSIVRPQMRGEEWLKRLQMPGEYSDETVYNTLCGPDEFYSRFVLPIGIDFFYGTMVPEMMLLFKKHPKGRKRFDKVLKHDFNKCLLMRRLRKKEKKYVNGLNKMVIKANKKKRKQGVAK